MFLAPWSAADTESVAAMILEGASMRQIASEFDITRNAVIGRIHRDRMLLRLMKRQGYRPPKPKPKPPKPPRKKPEKPLIIPEIHRDFGDWEEKEMLATMREPEDPEETSTPPNSAAKPLLKRGPDQCAYPVRDAPEVVGGFLFCCLPIVEGSSYCEAHRRRCIARGPSL